MPSNILFSVTGLVTYILATVAVAAFVAHPAPAQGIIPANGDHNRGSSGGSSNNGHGDHHSQSQSIAQVNVCGNGDGVSDNDCQNLPNQIQESGNAGKVTGVQSGRGSGNGNNGGGSGGSTSPSISIPTTINKSQACQTAGFSSAKSNSCNGMSDNNVIKSGGLRNLGRT
jgi:hypothetical protein